MQKHDRAALTLALERARAESPQRDEQLTSMLEDRPWQQVAEFAATVCQRRSLKLYPWQRPPCDLDEDDESDTDAVGVKLLRKMLDLGVSRFHPERWRQLKPRRRSKKARHDRDRLAIAMEAAKPLPPEKRGTQITPPVSRGRFAIFQ